MWKLTDGLNWPQAICSVTALPEAGAGARRTGQQLTVSGVWETGLWFLPICRASIEDRHPGVSGLTSSRFVGPTERELHLEATRVSPGEAANYRIAGAWQT